MGIFVNNITFDLENIIIIIEERRCVEREQKIILFSKMDKH